MSDLDVVTAEAVDRLMSMDLSAEALVYGVDWYADAQRSIMVMAAVHGRAMETVAGVVAALSPRMAWAQNLVAADRILADPDARVGTGANRAKARRIIDGEAPLDVLGGFKVRAFFMNLIGVLDAVTVDIWAFRAAVDPEAGDRSVKRLERKGWYEAVAAAYREAAGRLGWPPAVFQAVVWCQVRGAHA